MNFYCDEYLKGEDKFDYEDFYDFFMGYVNNTESKPIIEDFFEKLKTKYGKEYFRDLYNAIFDFKRTYSQLLRHHLHNFKYIDGGAYGNYPPYDTFVQLILNFTKKYNVHIHSLNHDLLIDFLGERYVGLQSVFANGFNLFGSPFYGSANSHNEYKGQKFSVGYDVKIPYYTGKFDKPVCYYKLHGSIDNVIVRDSQTNQSYRLKRKYGVSHFQMEKLNESKEEFQSVWDEVEPDFLSGKFSKVDTCKKDPYYSDLFNRFENNLKSSDLLIVIGYGFKDVLINQYIEDYYLKSGKPILVVNPGIPDSELLKNYSYEILQKKIEYINLKEFLDKLPSSMTL